MGKPLYDEQLRHEQELRKVTERLTRRATRLQAHEYARRLNELNGEAGRIRLILAETVSRERFDAYIESQREALALALDAEEIKRANLEERLAVATRTLQRLEGAVGLVRFIGIGGLVGLAIGLYSIFGPH